MVILESNSSEKYGLLEFEKSHFRIFFFTKVPFRMTLLILLYSRAMKTQHPTVHQYLKDILSLLSQHISGDFMKTKDRHHIGFISFNVKCPNIYTLAYFQTEV